MKYTYLIVFTVSLLIALQPNSARANFATLAEKVANFKRNYCSACKNLGQTMCSRPAGKSAIQKLREIEAADAQNQVTLSDKEIKQRHMLSNFAATRSGAGYACKTLCKSKLVYLLGVINEEEWWLEVTDLSGLSKCMEEYFKMPAVRKDHKKKITTAYNNKILKVYVYDDHIMDSVMDLYKKIIEISSYNATEDQKQQRANYFDGLVAVSENTYDRMMKTNPVKHGMEIQLPRLKKAANKLKQNIKDKRAKKANPTLKKPNTYTPKNYDKLYQPQSFQDMAK